MWMSVSITRAAYFPDNGALWYNGGVFADSYFSRTSPGPWAPGDPGYEHDFKIRSRYMRACTSWTSLPAGYDDCPTAGWSETTGDL